MSASHTHAKKICRPDHFARGSGGRLCPIGAVGGGCDAQGPEMIVEPLVASILGSVISDPNKKRELNSSVP